MLARLRRPGDDVEAEISDIRGVQDTMPGRAWSADAQGVVASGDP